jgi:hypothetical protein
MNKCDRCDNMTDNEVLISSYMSKEYIEKYGDKAKRVCDECEEKADAEIEWENEQDNDYPTCPACGFFSDYIEPEEYNLDNEETICHECGESYVVTANHSISFTTKRIKKDK